eukprot:g74394.t1
MPATDELDLSRQQQAPLASPLLETSPFERLDSLSLFVYYTLYESRTRFYIAGATRDKSLHKVLEIDRTQPGQLRVKELPVSFSRDEMKELLLDREARHKTTGGLKELFTFSGILGVVRLPRLHMLLATSREVVGQMGSHVIYALRGTKVIQIAHNSFFKQALGEGEVEAGQRYEKMFSQVDWSRDFYFSYTYDLTRPVQVQVAHQCNHPVQGVQPPSHLRRNNSHLLGASPIDYTSEARGIVSARRGRHERDMSLSRNRGQDVERSETAQSSVSQASSVVPAATSTATEGQVVDSVAEEGKDGVLVGKNIAAELELDVEGGVAASPARDRQASTNRPTPKGSGDEPSSIPSSPAAESRDVPTPKEKPENEESQQPYPSFNSLFVWNFFMTQELINVCPEAAGWVLPVLHGFFRQERPALDGPASAVASPRVESSSSTVNSLLNATAQPFAFSRPPTGQNEREGGDEAAAAVEPVIITLIARRSRRFAGPRFIKRGITPDGFVANEVESELILHNPSGLASLILYRGSIPLFWKQSLNPVTLATTIEVDPKNRTKAGARAAKYHFDRLFQCYGSPVIIVNLIKHKENTARETLLGAAYEYLVSQQQLRLERGGEKMTYSGSGNSLSDGMDSSASSSAVSSPSASTRHARSKTQGSVPDASGRKTENDSEADGAGGGDSFASAADAYSTIATGSLDAHKEKKKENKASEKEKSYFSGMMGSIDSSFPGFSSEIKKRIGHGHGRTASVDMKTVTTTETAHEKTTTVTTTTAGPTTRVSLQQMFEKPTDTPGRKEAQGTPAEGLRTLKKSASSSSTGGVKRPSLVENKKGKFEYGTATPGRKALVVDTGSGSSKKKPPQFPFLGYEENDVGNKNRKVNSLTVSGATAKAMLNNLQLELQRIKLLPTREAQTPKLGTEALPSPRLEEADDSPHASDASSPSGSDDDDEDKREGYAGSASTPSVSIVTGVAKDAQGRSNSMGDLTSLSRLFNTSADANLMKAAHYPADKTILPRPTSRLHNTVIPEVATPPNIPSPSNNPFLTVPPKSLSSSSWLSPGGPDSDEHQLLKYIAYDFLNHRKAGEDVMTDLHRIMSPLFDQTNFFLMRRMNRRRRTMLVAPATSAQSFADTLNSVAGPDGGAGADDVLTPYVFASSSSASSSSSPSSSSPPSSSLSSSSAPASSPTSPPPPPLTTAASPSPASSTSDAFPESPLPAHASGIRADVDTPTSPPRRRLPEPGDNEKAQVSKLPRSILSSQPDSQGDKDQANYTPGTFYVKRWQIGLVRINCVDCLDRTNVAQFALSKVALGQMLRNVTLANPGNAEVPSQKEKAENSRSPSVQVQEQQSALYKSTLSTLTRLFTAHGDQIAQQYAGSGAMHRDALTSGQPSQEIMDKSETELQEKKQQQLEKLKEQCSAAGSRLMNLLAQLPPEELDKEVESLILELQKRFPKHEKPDPVLSALMQKANKLSNTTQGLTHNAMAFAKRWHSNAFTDSDKQMVMDLVLGNYIPGLQIVTSSNKETADGRLRALPPSALTHPHLWELTPERIHSCHDYKHTLYPMRPVLAHVRATDPTHPRYQEQEGQEAVAPALALERRKSLQSSPGYFDQFMSAPERAVRATQLFEELRAKNPNILFTLGRNVNKNVVVYELDMEESGLLPPPSPATLATNDASPVDEKDKVEAQDGLAGESANTNPIPPLVRKGSLGNSNQPEFRRGKLPKAYWLKFDPADVEKFKKKGMHMKKGKVDFRQPLSMLEKNTSFGIQWYRSLQHNKIRGVWLAFRLHLLPRTIFLRLDKVGKPHATMLLHGKYCDVRNMYIVTKERKIGPAKIDKIYVLGVPLELQMSAASVTKAAEESRAGAKEGAKDDPQQKRSQSKKDQSDRNVEDCIKLLQNDRNIEVEAIDPEEELARARANAAAAQRNKRKPPTNIFRRATPIGLQDTQTFLKSVGQVWDKGQEALQ